MAGGDQTVPNLPQIIRDLETRIKNLESQVAPSSAKSVIDLADVYVDPLARAAGDTILWNGADHYVTGSVGDGLWEIASSTGGALGFIQPLAALTDGGDDSINGAYLGEFEYDTGTYLHKAFFQITPGTNGPGHSISNGQDIRAAAWVAGHDALMDWYFWSRHASGGAFEAGTFFDAIGDDGAGHQPEAYMEVSTFGGPDWMAFVNTASGGTGLIGIFPDSDDVAYLDIEGDGNTYLKFRKEGSNPFPVAPDAQLGPGDWSIGVNGIDLVYKINDAGTIKTATLTPT